MHFAEQEHRDRTFDHIIYALGGSTPENFLRAIGIAFQGKQPDVTQGYETSIKGLYLIGDLAPESGSIILAFNTSRDAMKDICESHLGCTIPPPRDSGVHGPEHHAITTGIAPIDPVHLRGASGSTIKNAAIQILRAPLECAYC